MVLLYHEIEVEFPKSQKIEKHQATLLEFGKTEKGRTTSAMALTVGIPAAIGALVTYFIIIVIIFSFVFLKHLNQG